MKSAHRIAWSLALATVSLESWLCSAALGQTSARPKPASAAAATGGTIKTPVGDLEIFPANNPWNQDVSKLPIHPRSSQYISSIGLTRGLHPDFGTVWEGAPIGIPYMLVPGGQRKVSVRFLYESESDRGPYPIPPNPLIEGGPNAPLDSDRHIIMVDYHNKKLYELFNAVKESDGWRAGSGAIFDLTSNNLRPAGWTSADAAGLPIFPGLVRYDEVVLRKEIRHALRFTTRRTQRAYILPATHWASSSRDANLPPMGLRVRMKANFDISGFRPNVQVILKALKTYGMFVADNGSDWFISRAADSRWSDDELRALKSIKGSAFEAVDTGPLVKG